MTELETARESCGLMLVLEGGVQTTINLYATKEEVIEAIQDHVKHGKQGLLEFRTASPDEREICLFNPRKVLLAVLKKEFVIQSGKIQPVQVIPGVPPSNTPPGRRR